jgi:16S rRNA (guanine527-N7)-methyltransferase
VIERLRAVTGRDVSRETFERLVRYAGLLTDENARQNLVSASSIADLWDRHILDSAQLVRFAPSRAASWIDIGSGAGLPGLVVACLVDGPVTLVEPRRLRAEFLHSAAESLELRVRVVPAKAERVDGTFDVISARAVAPLCRLIELSRHLSTGKTTWILPKGRNAESELAEARHAWQGVFHVEQSLTDADSRIIVGTGVKARRKA